MASDQPEQAPWPPPGGPGHPRQLDPAPGPAQPNAAPAPRTPFRWWLIAVLAVVVGVVAAASAWLAAQRGGGEDPPEEDPKTEALTEVQPTAEVPEGGELVWVCEGCQGSVGGSDLGVYSIWEDAGVAKARIKADWCGPDSDVPDLVLGAPVEVDGCGTIELVGVRLQSSHRYAAAFVVVPVQEPAQEDR